jgi:hypothetical protein
MSIASRASVRPSPSARRTAVRNPRSTVGTTTEIHDYMRLLYARVGRTICRQCGREVTRETAEIVPAADRRPAGRHAPAHRLRDARRGDSRRPADAGDRRLSEELDDKEEGESRAAATRSPRRSGAAPARLRPPARGRPRVAFDEVDPARCGAPRRSTWWSIACGSRAICGSRLTDSIETAYREGGGAAFAVVLDEPDAPRRLAGSSSPSGSSAAPAASPTRRRSRACSPSTIRSAPARLPRLRQRHRARHRTSSCRIRRARSQGAIEPWTKPHYRAQLASSARRAHARACGSTCRGRI